MSVVDLSSLLSVVFWSFLRWAVELVEAMNVVQNCERGFPLFEFRLELGIDAALSL
jgi:hypothetical protein